MRAAKKMVSQLVGSIDQKVASFEGWSMKTKGIFPTALSVAKALMKFCEDHERNVPALRSCVEALEGGNAHAAKTAFVSMAWGGMMSFADWTPPVVQSGETPEYVSTVFESLTERFYRLMVELLEIKRGEFHGVGGN